MIFNFCIYILVNHITYIFIKRKILSFLAISGSLFLLINSCKTNDLVQPDSKVNADLMAKSVSLKSNLSATDTIKNDGYIVFLKNNAQSYRSLIASVPKAYKEQQNQSRAAANAFLKKVKIDPNKVEAVYGTFPGFFAKISDAEAQLLKNDVEVEKVVPNQVFNAITGVMDNTVKWNPFRTNLSFNNYPGFSDATPAGVTRVGGGNMNATTGNSVWVLDSGCDLYNSELNIDQTRAATFVSGTSSAQDDNGHGTHVAGIIGAKANNAGIVGVAPNARLVPVKVTNFQGQTSEAIILSGLDYIQSMVVANNTADIVNVSLGSNSRNTSTVLDEKIIAMSELGIRFVIAAGNSRDDTQYYPMARIQHYNIWVIAAIDASNDNFANYYPGSSTQGSNYGASISYADPGVNVYSTVPGTYDYMSGTSMAAPHYTGILMYPYVSCNCSCDLGPLSVTLDDQVAKQQKAAQRQGFCVTDPSPSYAHNVPNSGTEQIGVVTKMRYRPY